MAGLSLLGCPFPWRNGLLVLPQADLPQAGVALELHEARGRRARLGRAPRHAALQLLGVDVLAVAGDVAEAALALIALRPFDLGGLLVAQRRERARGLDVERLLRLRRIDLGQAHDPPLLRLVLDDQRIAVDD